MSRLAPSSSSARARAGARPASPPARSAAPAAPEAPPASALQCADLGPFLLESGRCLADLRLAWESWGRLNERGDNAVLVLHALTGDTHAHGTPEDPGWWDGLIGPGRALDPREHFIVSIGMIGGCAGSSGPSSPDPATGLPSGPDFPQPSIRDSARAERLLLERLGVTRLAAVLGGSMGGARALEWAVTNPDLVERCVVVASTAASTAEQIALGGMQVRAVQADPAFRGGRYDPAQPPVTGLSLARQIAHLSYRSEAELEGRFSRCPQESGEWAGRFAVESYLEHQGRKLTERFDANSYILLTRALMGHDVGRARGGVRAALSRAEGVRFLIASVDSDRLYLPAQSERLARALGAPHVSISAPNGHDAFLTHAHAIDDDVRRLLSS